VKQAEAQAVRFVRLFAAALLAQIIALMSVSHITTWRAGVSLVVSAVVGALEVAWRQFFPVVRADAIAYAAREQAPPAGMGSSSPGVVPVREAPVEHLASVRLDDHGQPVD